MYRTHVAPTFLSLYCVFSFGQPVYTLSPNTIVGAIHIIKVRWCDQFNFDGKCIMPRGRINHFTVVCSVTWPPNGSEAGGDLILIKTLLILFFKSSCSDVSLHKMRKGKRFVSERGHFQPRFHLKARYKLSTQL